MFTTQIETKSSSLQLREYSIIFIKWAFLYKHVSIRASNLLIFNRKLCHLEKSWDFCELRPQTSYSIPTQPWPVILFSNYFFRFIRFTSDFIIKWIILFMHDKVVVCIEYFQSLFIFWDGFNITWSYGVARIFEGVGGTKFFYF